MVVDVTPAVTEEPVEAEPPKVEKAKAEEPEPKIAKGETSPAATPGPKVTEPETSKKAGYVPMRAPDDPGVSQADADESPTSLERLRAAQIR